MSDKPDQFRLRTGGLERTAFQSFLKCRGGTVLDKKCATPMTSFHCATCNTGMFLCPKCDGGPICKSCGSQSLQGFVEPAHNPNVVFKEFCGRCDEPISNCRCSR